MACSETQSLLYKIYTSRTSVRPAEFQTTHAVESDLQQLRESFHNPGIFVAVYLHRVDERNLGLWVVTKWFEDFRESL